jgi:hypothetical protein
MSILPKAIYRFSAIPIKIHKASFMKLEKNPIISMGSQNPHTAKEILRKKKTRGIILFDFKIYYKTNGTEYIA